MYFGPRELNNIACKCDAKQCDQPLRFDWPPDGATLVQLTSDKQGRRFQLAHLQPTWARQDDRKRLDALVRLDLSARRQQVAGFGGAVTDSAALLLGERLGGELGERALRSYFAPDGLNYNLARLPVGGTDMSWRPYTCNEPPEDAANGGAPKEDFELRHFSLQEEDLKHKLPLLVRALQLRLNETPSSHWPASSPNAQPLRLLATSWSAPNWMKSQHDLVQGHLRGATGGPYYDAYARYIIRFMDEYEWRINEALLATTLGNNSGQVSSSNLLASGWRFKFWAMTPQNEPRTPSRLGRRVVNYNSMNFSPSQMSQYVSENLVPNLLRSNRTAEQFALFVWDDTLLGLEEYRQSLLFAEDKATRDYVRGMAVHWYSQALDKLPYSSLYDLRRTLPYKFSLISTEASFIGRPKPGDWARGERYARDVMVNLRLGSVGWIDWNLALNMEGGPTWSGNYLDAALLVDEKAGCFYKNPMYYALGHISRFVRAHSHVVHSDVFVRAAHTPPPPHSHTAALHSAASATQANASHWRSSSPFPDGPHETARQLEEEFTLIDERAEQTSDLLALAGELDPRDQPQWPGDSGGGQTSGWRRIALVLLNRADTPRSVGVDLGGALCRLEGRAASQLAGQSELPKVGEPGELLWLNLTANSITSFAFNC